MMIVVRRYRINVNEMNPKPWFSFYWPYLYSASCCSHSFKFQMSELLDFLVHFESEHIRERGAW